MKVNEIAFSTSIVFISLVKEVKQHKYAIEAQRDSDYNTKSQLVVIICIILLVTIGFKTQSVYEKVEAVTPQTNKEILGVVEKAAKPTEP